MNYLRTCGGNRLLKMHIFIIHPLLNMASVTGSMTQSYIKPHCIYVHATHASTQPYTTHEWIHRKHTQA